MTQALAVHRLQRIRIGLGVPEHEAQRLTDACSRLFHRRLRTVIETVLHTVQQQCGSLTLSEPLILDLGELPLAGFESLFCQRLEQQLLQALRAYAAIAGPLATVNSPPFNAPSNLLLQLSRYLQHGEWPAAPAFAAELSAWLLEDWAAAAPQSLPVLAGHCLHRGQLSRLHRLLSPAHVKRLGLCLSGLTQWAAPLTPGTLQLCALRYFQRHPHQALPVSTPPEVATVGEHDEPLVRMLFAQDPSPSPAWRAQLHRLSQQPVARDLLQRQRPGEAALRLSARRHHTEAAITPTSVTVPGRASAPGSMPPPAHPRHDSRLAGLTSQPPQPVHNGGITLLWPLLPALFERLGLMQQSRFLHRQAQMQACCWLDELIWADGQYAPWRMPLNKLLCGLPLDSVVEQTAADAQALDVMQQWLAQLPERLPAWRHFSVPDIRQLYLQRPAWLVPQSGDVSVYIQPQVYDVLLADWPWPTDLMMLPWLTKPLMLHWSHPPGIA